MNFGFPIATIRISACLHNSFKFFVLECAMVTVAFSRSISIRHRFSYDVASADHYTMFSFYFNIRTF